MSAFKLTPTSKIEMILGHAELMTRFSQQERGEKLENTEFTLTIL